MRALPATAGLVSSPMPLAETVTVSPGVRNRGGFMNVPQPAGVPVMRQSPGSRVMIEWLTDERVLARSSPLTCDWMRTACQSCMTVG